MERRLAGAPIVCSTCALMVVHGPASIFGSPASCGTLPRCCKHVWYQWQHLLPPPRKLHGGASRPLAPPPPRFASLLLPQLLARQRIPSGQYADPLGHIFDEFDKDRRWVLAEGGGGAAER